MLKLNLEKGRGPLKVLCLGAHSDDIEIGCGGLILSLLKGRRPVDVTWVVFSASREREREARRGAAAFLKGAKRANVIVKQFKDGHFPYEGAAVKSVFEALKSINPDLVLTHYRDDRHQDHRVLRSRLNTFRDHFVLEYEIPKFDGDPNSLTAFTARSPRRLHSELPPRVLGTQRDKHWFSSRRSRAEDGVRIPADTPRPLFTQGCCDSRPTGPVAWTPSLAFSIRPATCGIYIPTQSNDSGRASENSTTSVAIRGPDFHSRRPQPLPYFDI